MHVSVGHEKSWKLTENVSLGTEKQEIPQLLGCFCIVLNLNIIV